MIVLGIDPGPETHGWALLDMSGPRPKWIDASKSTSDGMRIVIPQTAPDLVAVEVPSRVLPFGKPVAQRARGAQLAATSLQAGRILGACDGLGYEAVQIDAATWRKVLGARTDATIKTAIARLVEGCPKRSNVHERDAAGVAIGAYRRWMLERRKTG